MKKYIEALKQAEYILNNEGIESARLEAELLLAHVLKVGRLYLYVNLDQELTQEQIDSYHKLIQRRSVHEPTAYILGHREFMDLDLIVNEDVLIPRPETEVLVETVIDHLNDIGTRSKEQGASEAVMKRELDPRLLTLDPKNPLTLDPIRIADIGTGSGAIAISLAKSFPNAAVEAVDISEEAINIAKLNADRYGLQITFHLGDLLSPLSDNKYNAIVSNPPYIPSQIIDGLQAEVKEYEPRTALDGGNDGLDFYRRLIVEVPKLLTENGFLAVEIGFDQAASVKSLIEDTGLYGDVEVIKDLSHNDRVVVAKL